MVRRVGEIFDGRPLLDIGSYGRSGPTRRDRFSPAEIDLIRRTVSRTPEVVVKVLTRGGGSLSAVRAHLAYLSRQGVLELETDQGERMSGKGVESRLVNDWDLDVEECRRRLDLRPRKDRALPKLVHKVLFSMPPGTPPEKVLAAVKSFAREEFGLRHRYAMVLHTDEPHPHVHLVVKAVGERGERLSIRKATLRKWRASFAERLRQFDVPANATERAVRGRSSERMPDGMFRAAERGESNRIRERVETVARELMSGGLRHEANGATIARTREEVTNGWSAISRSLAEQGDWRLAAEIERFTRQMMPARTNRQKIAAKLLGSAFHQRELRDRSR